MIFPFDPLLEAVLPGIVLGGFYAALSIGLSLLFGLLEVPHVAYLALMVLGAYCTTLLGSYGFDPILAGIALTPIFFVLGVLIHRFYSENFERRGADAGARGLAFFFGLAFIVVVFLIFAFGVDPRMGEAESIGGSLELGDYRIPWRMIVAFGLALLLALALSAYLSRTFTGRAIQALAQDAPALRLMGANPVRIRQWAFGIATAVTALAGAMLILVGPLEPGLDRLYIGRTVFVVALAGLGSMTATLAAGLLLGLSESIVFLLLGASWAPAIAFGLLLIVLGLRPQGLFGR